MLPPRLIRGLASRPRSLSSPCVLMQQTPPIAALRPSASQARLFWCRRRPNDWASHLDPLYHRFTRYRTLKTRAKLLATLKRRSKFDWDLGHKPFFTPKQLRFASHWGQNPRTCRWQQYDENDEAKKDNRDDKVDPLENHGDGLELSKREKLWREQTEALKRRIRQDPYEAVFGKRFEPFWSPLVPSWMREEMGLQGWPKSVKLDQETPKPSKAPTARAEEPNRQETPKDQHPAKTRPATNEITPQSETKPSHDVKPLETPKSYSSYSSTSWDSWTQKTRRTTWDSISGQTKRFEYDPISNRMVQVEGVGTPVKQVESVETLPQQPTQQPKTASTALTAAEPQAVDIPVKKTMDLRRSIPVPTDIEAIQDRPLDMATLINQPSAIPAKPHDNPPTPVKSTRPPELAKMPENDLDLLTPESVRASMGKRKSTGSGNASSARDKANMELSFDEASNPVGDRMRFIYKGYPYIPQVDLELLHGRAKSVPETNNATTSPLQPAVERMQSKQLPAHQVDSNAENLLSKDNRSVPKNWQNQASLLQADRVRRTSAKRPYPMSRWIDDMEAKKEQYERKAEMLRAEQSIEMIDRRKRTEKAEALLNEEIRNQKFRMQAHEGNWKHHVAKAAGESGMKQGLVKAHSERTARETSDQSSARPAPAAEVTREQQHKAMQGEGDFCTNVTKYMDSSRWYKQPSNGPSKQDLEKAAQKAHDQALVQEVREIYEREYGSITPQHTQPEATKTAKTAEKIHDDIDLGEALAKHEKVDQYSWKRDNLEAEIAAQEREAHESQTLMAPESSAKLRSVIAESLPGPKIVNDQEPKLIPTGIPSKVETNAEIPTKVAGERAETSIQWEEPPLYKVIAYDSGNDMFSTATTTSNFTGSDTPISIPTALSQLYQPARFVPHFAQLQEEGFQVIYGTKDLLVFKKVKSSETTAANASGSNNAQAFAGSSPGEEAVRQHAQSSVNPVDGTSKQQTPQVSTGNFASPTGFVNHDVLFSPKDAPGKPSESAWESMERMGVAERPKVRREEDVFTGTRSNWPSKQERREARAKWRDARRAEKAKKETRGNAFQWMLIGSGVFAAMAYLIGSAAEKAREDGRGKKLSLENAAMSEREKEVWQQMVERRRRRE